jgi:hypothetical protein
MIRKSVTIDKNALKGYCEALNLAVLTGLNGVGLVFFLTIKL